MRAQVLGVALFVAFWVVLALALLLVAIRGGVGARPTPRRPRRAVGSTIAFVIVYTVFGVALPLVFLIGNHARTSAQVGGIRLTADEKQGRLLFGQHCGLCHTLAAANAVGKVGPDLDTLQPPAELVLHTIQYGCVQNAAASSPEACLGYGTMPADVVQGKDAAQIAAFVGTVAGKE